MMLLVGVELFSDLYDRTIHDNDAVDRSEFVPNSDNGEGKDGKKSLRKGPHLS
jgi:hypothetical protein